MAQGKRYLSLEEKLRKLGPKFGEIDEEIVRLLAKRARLSLKVGKVKKRMGLALTRPQIEKDRLSAVLVNARKYKHPNPALVKALYEACIIPQSTALQVADERIISHQD